MPVRIHEHVCLFIQNLRHFRGPYIELSMSIQALGASPIPG